MLKHNLQTILFRCDATPQIGLGHVMRCLALAEAWQDQGGSAALAMAAGSPAVETRIRAAGVGVVPLYSARDEVGGARSPAFRRKAAGKPPKGGTTNGSFPAAEGISVGLASALGCDAPGGEEDAKRLIAAAQQADARWLVCDGYHFGADYQRAVVEAGLRLLAVDDFGHAADYWAHLVLNPNFDAREAIYARRRDYTRLLLGPSYILLRREFAPWRTFSRSIPPQATRLLVTCGGSDPGKTTAKIVEALGRTGLENLEATVIVGSENLDCDRIRKLAEKTPCPIRVWQSVADMAEVMAWADMAVIVVGTSLWELHFLGCPTMSFGRGALHEPFLRELESAGLVRYLGCEDAAEPQAVAGEIARFAGNYRMRNEMSAAGRKLVDGQGAARVVRAMRGYERDQP